MPDTEAVDWERLYRDMRHRVGNTMQMLLSLLRLQMRQGAPGAAPGLARLEIRMTAAASAYALARVSTDDSPQGAVVVDFAAYVAEMVEEARRQVEPDMAPEVTLDLAPLEVPLETAIPLGIAVTEVLVNALVYGGPPLSVTLEPQPESAIMCLTVCDGGSGVPQETLRADGMGLKVAESLMRQVRGKLVLDEGPVRLEWPV